MLFLDTYISMKILKKLCILCYGLPGVGELPVGQRIKRGDEK